MKHSILSLLFACCTSFSMLGSNNSGDLIGSHKDDLIAYLKVQVEMGRAEQQQQADLPDWIYLKKGMILTKLYLALKEVMEEEYRRLCELPYELWHIFNIIQHVSLGPFVRDKKVQKLFRRLEDRLEENVTKKGRRQFFGSIKDEPLQVNLYLKSALRLNGKGEIEFVRSPLDSPKHPYGKSFAVQS